MAVCNAGGDQFAPRSATDGAGGVFVTWQDARSLTQYDIYLQHVNSAGTALFGSGLAITNLSSTEISPVLVADGLGGALIAWQSDYTGTNDIYCNQVSAAGLQRWANPGVNLCYSVAGEQTAPVITADGAHGAIIAWTDQRNGPDDVYAQRIDYTATARWSTNGVPVGTGIWSQSSPALVADGLGGAILAWSDSRLGVDYDISAQQLNSSGTPQWAD